MRTPKLFGALSLVLAASCAPTAHSVAHEASKAAVSEGSEQLRKQETQQGVASLVKDPEMKQALQEMASEFAQGVLNGLQSEQGRRELGGTIDVMTQAWARQLVATLGAEQTRRELGGLAQSMTDAAFKQAATSMQSELRPVVRAMIQEDVAAGMTTALRGQLQPELGRTAQNVAYHAVVGANTGLGAAWFGESGVAAQARGASHAGRAWLWGGLSVLGLLALMLVSGAVMMVASARRTRAEVARLESATLLLATAMRERQQSEQTDEVVAIVQQALAGRAEQTGKHRILGALRMRKSA